MKSVKLSSNEYLIRLERGEEIIESLINLDLFYNWGFAEFSGIGALSRPKLGFYNLETQEYSYKIFNDNFEIINLLGNISRIDSKAVCHCHVVLSRQDFSCVGGHLESAYVAATCEIKIKFFKTQIARKLNKVIGLKLIDI